VIDGVNVGSGVGDWKRVGKSASGKGLKETRGLFKINIVPLIKTTVATTKMAVIMSKNRPPPPD
jgi:hypothetical protein